ncbi:hypothetical protein GFL09_02045 [Pseudomonas stutzeri]|uniref:hypothetical protein n=1 Tax=Stutzerimonas stutzeri TaxID=316 RepID=UPI00190979FB|nr:hypothetical protein [Stutzerimonas stutzeri]MBK3866489.1 hypothetical protein [Stutzerimonas stutzeri]
MKNESGVIAAFVRNMTDLASAKGVFFQHYPTGGQDRKLLGDAVFTNTVDYSLIEFKDSIGDGFSERTKQARVLALCCAVHSSDEMRNLHDHCHLFAGDDEVTGEQVLFIYRHAVCNRSVFPEPPADKKQCLDLNCDDKNIIYLDEYAEGLFSGRSDHTLSAPQFNEYLQCLVKATAQGQKGGEICLIASDTNSSGRFISVRFNTILELHDWFQKKQRGIKYSYEDLSAGPK